MADHKQQMIKYFEQFRYKYDMWTVFSDFLELASYTISNSCDKSQYDKREKRYIEIISKYDKKDSAIFPKIFAELVLALEDTVTDVLGEIFMMLNISDKWKGQFFTPYSVSKCCAEMTFDEEGINKYIEEKGYISLQEPACGGGSMIIAFAEVMKEHNINYQQKLLVTGVDVDLRSVHMCYIQCALLGIPAIIVHGNTLSMEMKEEYITPFYVFGNFAYKEHLYREKRKQEAVNSLNNDFKHIIDMTMKDICSLRRCI